MAYPNSAIPVTNPLGVTAETDTYPTHLASLGKGGHRTVATIAERDAIPVDRREFGMTVTVISGSNVETYMLKNIALGGVNDTLSNNDNWKINFEIANTGDYYVHSSTGVDKAGNGSVIAPFKTIQYAIDQLNQRNIYDATIKVLAGTYTFTNETLYYAGIIDFANGAIVNSIQDSGNALINGLGSGQINITGKATFNIKSGIFLSYQSSGGAIQNIECKEVVKFNFSENISYLIKGGLNSNLNQLNIKGCSFRPEILASLEVIQLWDSPQKCVFVLDTCNFRNICITVANDSVSNVGGSTIKNCTFYGNGEFKHPYYLNIQQPNSDAQTNKRFLSIQACNFDMVSLICDTTNNIFGSAIIIDQNDVSFALSKCSFSRKPPHNNVVAIRNEVYTGVRIAMFQNISVAPISGVIDEVFTDQFIYLSSTNTEGFRF